MDQFNRHMIVLAREARGLSQPDLSSRLSVGQGTLSKYETGFLPISEDFIADAASVLEYPCSFFRQPGRPYGFPPFHYRKRKKLSAKALGKIVAEMNIRRMHIAKLIVAYNARRNTFIPEMDMDDYSSRKKGRVDIEDVARIVREGWMLPSGPILNVVNLLEENGGIVVPCDFGTDLLDAMSQRIDGLPVLFFINRHAPADRIRHTLAHELGHMVLHTVALKDDMEMENEADTFAGAFLLPATEIRPQLRRFDLPHLANMKAYWKVSMQAIAVRADRLDLITPYQKKMFWMEMSKLGYRKREPNEPLAEEPKLLQKMVGFHVKSLGYSRSDMAAMLDITVPEFDRMYGPPSVTDAPQKGSHLTVVK